MKQADINKYSDDELRQIWWKIERNEIENLPYKIAYYIIHADSIPVIGNEQTRKNRLKTIITLEIQHRFLHGKLVQKVPNKSEINEWLSQRIAELQEEYRAINYDDCHDEIGNITNSIVFTKKLTIGGKISGYKQCRDFMRTHKEKE